MAAPQTVTPPEYETAGEPPFSWRAILEIVQALALAVVISVVLNLFVVQVTEVRQNSMVPTLLQNDRVLVSKLDYRFGVAQRGDIIVFNPPIPDATIPYVKRVIAVAGETVDLRNGSVFVNGKPVDFPQAHGATQPQAPQIVYPFTVPDGQIFVMGDNRTFSSDSRTFGPVPVGNIIGKVILRFWPFDRLVFFEW
ncbi:MAG: signal peptidase I [Chloroflexi bacterium]|nr:MAG: signal peptidase I [Chloroflexota bacterium]TMG52565.1 MAG: signal peptidase I [Chloroflexota bacterium]